MSDPSTAIEGTAEGVAETTSPEASTEVGQEEVVSDSPRYSVKIDGADQEVDVDELRNGYMRQRDYTQKTQAIAAEKERLARAEAVYAALERDPAAALSALSQVYELDTQTLDEDLDPIEARFSRLEQAEAQRARQSEIAAINAEIEGLQTRHGDFDRDQLIDHAVKYGIGNLEAAYFHMTARNQVEAEQTAEKQRRAEQALTAKRQAAVVEGGTSVRGTSTGTSARPSFREALAAAKQSMGYTG